jgi:hypothetical protein
VLAPPLEPALGGLGAEPVGFLVAAF